MSNYYIELEIVCDETVKLADNKQTEFNLALNAISLLFEQRVIYKFTTLQKIRINLFDDERKLTIYEPDKISPIAFIEKSFDFDYYFAQNKIERRKIILETLYEAIVALCEKAGYGLSPFTQAYEKVKELNYENRFIYNKLTSSPNRKHKAGIQIEVNEEAADISVVFDTAKQLNNIKILRTLPHYMFIYRFIHKGKWIDNEHYMVSDKSGQVHFTASLTGGEATVEFTPKNRTAEELKMALQKIKVNNI